MTPAKLKRIRADAGLTQKKMAQKLFIALPTYKHWEGLDEFGPRMQVNVELRVERWLSKGDK